MILTNSCLARFTGGWPLELDVDPPFFVDGVRVTLGLADLSFDDCDEGDELYYEDYEDEKYGSEPALMIDASALVSLSTVDIFLMN